MFKLKRFMATSKKDTFVKEKLNGSRNLFLDFEAPNIIPSSSDILYRNPQSIKNRQRLYQIYRTISLRTLDMPSFVELRKSNNFSAPDSTNCFKIALEYSSCHSSKHNTCTTAALISLDAHMLDSLPSDDLVRLKNRYGLTITSSKAHFCVSNFPLRKLNVALGREVVKSIVHSQNSSK